MSIAVIDQGAELYWFASSSLLQDEITLKHLNSIQSGESYILKELPKIVILNGDDSSIHAEKFIAKIRNHVFARNTLFVVFTADTSPEYKKALIIAGAGQILYRGKGHNPSPKFFRNLIKWFLNVKNPDPQTIEYKPVPFEVDGEFSTFGRIGWISASQCFIEVNLDLLPGQTIELKNTLMDELGIKDCKLTVLEKNKVGRYYQYANGYLCKIESKNTTKDNNNILAWITANQNLSKYKPIKVLYYEQNSENRENIRSMIKLDQRYCARGFANLETFQEELEYQLPHLILIDRQLIEMSKTKFEPLKKFIQSHFCYCVTYDNDSVTKLEDYKKNYDFAMHVPDKIESELLESMIKKLEVKMFAGKEDVSKNRVYFNKYSPYSRISLHTPCKVTELAISGIGVQLPYTMASYCAFEITAQGFTHLSLNRMQYFRSFINKKLATGPIYHQCIFMGQTLKDNELIKNATDKIKEVGFDKWKDETMP
ncbi:MAG: hypothetical protein H7177_07615 [Rhizobacter sp.]|nr:hypothetical protein [Bacteriovorax sp.]